MSNSPTSKTPETSRLSIVVPAWLKTEILDYAQHIGLTASDIVRLSFRQGVEIAFPDYHSYRDKEKEKTNGN